MLEAHATSPTAECAGCKPSVHNGPVLPSFSALDLWRFLGNKGNKGLVCVGSMGDMGPWAWAVGSCTWQQLAGTAALAAFSSQCPVSSVISVEDTVLHLLFLCGFVRRHMLKKSFCSSALFTILSLLEKKTIEKRRKPKKSCRNMRSSFP